MVSASSLFRIRIHNIRLPPDTPAEYESADLPTVQAYLGIKQIRRSDHTII